MSPIIPRQEDLIISCVTTQLKSLLHNVTKLKDMKVRWKTKKIVILFDFYYFSSKQH